MAVDSLAIINLGLLHLGERQVTAITDTDAAIGLNDGYDQTLRWLLRDYHFGFSTKRAALVSAVPVLTTEEALEWDYAWDKPSDWLATIRLSQTGDFDNDPYVDFAEEQNRLLTNDTPMYIKYAFLETDTTAFDPSFDDLFALALAARCSFKVSQSNTLKDDLNAQLGTYRKITSFHSARDQRPTMKRPGRFRRARIGYNRGGLISHRTHGI